MQVLTTYCESTQGSYRTPGVRTGKSSRPLKPGAQNGPAGFGDRRSKCRRQGSNMKEGGSCSPPQGEGGKVWSLGETQWTSLDWGKKRWGWARWFKRTVKRLELQFPFFTCRPCQREDVWSLPKPCSWYKVHAYLSGLLLCQREPFRPNLIGNVCLSPLPSGKLSSLIINRRQPFLWKESVRFFVGWL